MRRTIAATLLFATAAACGEDNTEPQVVVTFKRGMIPSGGHNIVFHDALGNALAYMKSDVDGRASYPIKGTGMVTIVEVAGNGITAALTIGGIEEGSELEFAMPRRGFGHFGREHVVLPGLIVGAPFYQLNNGCDSLDVSSNPGPTTGVDIFMWDDCVRMGKHDLLAFASNERDRIAYSARLDLDTDFSDTRTRLLPEWKYDLRRFGVVLENEPETVRRIVVSHGLIAGGILLESETKQIPSAMSARFSHPPDLGDSLVVSAYADHGDELGDVEYSYVELREDALTATVTFDLTGGFLPHLADAALDVEKDPMRPEITWTSEAATGADAMAILLQWRPFKRWTLIMPPDSQVPIRLPELPDTVSSARPDVPPVFDSAGVELLDYEGVDGYAGFIQAMGARSLEDRGPGRTRVSIALVR